MAEGAPRLTAAAAIDIRPLAPEDAPRYRDLMLEAYATAADAYTSTAEERAAEPLAFWVDRIAAASGQGRALGAFDGAALVGTVALGSTSKPKKRHIALVIGMYVRPTARRLGLGRRLMGAVIAEAATRPGVLRLALTVTEGNTAAVRLYEALGFETWGVEPMAIRTPDGFKGKVHMALSLPGTDDYPPGVRATRSESTKESS